MEQAFKYRFYPTPEQENLLRRTIGCTRLVYNRALYTRTEAWTQRQEKINYLKTSKLLTQFCFAGCRCGTPAWGQHPHTHQILLDKKLLRFLIKFGQKRVAGRSPALVLRSYLCRIELKTAIGLNLIAWFTTWFVDVSRKYANHLLNIKWFADVIIHASIQTSLAIFREGIGGHGDNPRLIV